MTVGSRQIMAIAGGCIAGAAFGGGVDAVGYQISQFFYLTNLTPNWNPTSGIPYPGLSSSVVVVAGAFFGLGLGMLAAAFIRKD